MNGINRNTASPQTGEAPPAEDVQDGESAFQAIELDNGLIQNLIDNLSDSDTNSFSWLDNISHISQEYTHLSNKAEAHTSQSQFLPTNAQPQISTTTSSLSDQSFFDWHSAQPDDYASGTGVPSSSPAVSAPDALPQSTLPLGNLASSASSLIQQVPSQRVPWQPTSSQPDPWQSNPLQQNQQNQQNQWQHGQHHHTQRHMGKRSASWLRPEELARYLTAQQNPQHQGAEQSGASSSNVSQPPVWTQQPSHVGSSPTSSSPPFSPPTSTVRPQDYFVPPSAMAQHMPIPSSNTAFFIPPLYRAGPLSHHQSHHQGYQISAKQTLPRLTSDQDTNRKRSPNEQEAQISGPTAKRKYTQASQPRQESQARPASQLNSSEEGSTRNSSTPMEMALRKIKHTAFQDKRFIFIHIRDKYNLLKNVLTYREGQATHRGTNTLLKALIMQVESLIKNVPWLIEEAAKKRNELEQKLIEHRNLTPKENYEVKYQDNYIIELTHALTEHHHAAKALDQELVKLLMLEPELKNQLRLYSETTRDMHTAP